MIDLAEITKNVVAAIYCPTCDRRHVDEPGKAPHREHHCVHCGRWFVPSINLLFQPNRNRVLVGSNIEALGGPGEDSRESVHFFPDGFTLQQEVQSYRAGLWPERAPHRWQFLKFVAGHSDLEFHYACDMWNDMATRGWASAARPNHQFNYKLGA